MLEMRKFLHEFPRRIAWNTHAHIEAKAETRISKNERNPSNFVKCIIYLCKNVLLLTAR